MSPIKVLIIGATSSIAQHTARLLALRGSEFVLVGRSQDRLCALSADLATRGATKVFTFATDLDFHEQHEGLIDQAWRNLERVDLVLIAHGILGDQERAQNDFSHAQQIFLTNCISTISLLTHLANRMTGQPSGAIAVITSVAGDRGRRSNYVYGASKAAVTTFLQGLRSRLHPKNIKLIEIRLGPVDTPMTQHLQKTRIFVKPETIAAGIVRALDRGADVIYLPLFWRWIMFCLKLLPEKLFKRLSL